MPEVTKVIAVAHRREKRACLRWGWRMVRREEDIRCLEQNLVMNVNMGRGGGWEAELGVTLRVGMRWGNLMEKSRVGAFF